MRQRYFTDVSPEALAFLKRLLCFDKNDRPTAAEALNDPWFSMPKREKSGKDSQVYSSQNNLHANSLVSPTRGRPISPKSNKSRSSSNRSDVSQS